MYLATGGKDGTLRVFQTKKDVIGMSNANPTTISVTGVSTSVNTQGLIPDFFPTDRSAYEVFDRKPL